MLLEREAELALLRGLPEGLHETGGCVALVRGEAGIGMGALVYAFVSGAGDGANLIEGACDDPFIPQALGQGRWYSFAVAALAQASARYAPAPGRPRRASMISPGPAARSSV